jgi:hypothetical protein
MAEERSDQVSYFRALDALVGVPALRLRVLSESYYSGVFRVFCPALLHCIHINPISKNVL